MVCVLSLRCGGKDNEMIDEKQALNTFIGRRSWGEGRQPQLIDASQKEDGSVEVFLDGEEAPSYKVSVVVIDLKQRQMVAEDILS